MCKFIYHKNWNLNTKLISNYYKNLYVEFVPSYFEEVAFRGEWGEKGFA